mgnify:CR=1 FL=1
MMSRPMVDAILEIKENNRYMKGIFSYVGFDTKWIGFHDEKHAGGQSKWNFVSLFTSHLFLFRCPHSVMCNHWYSLYACFLGVYSALFHDLYDDVLCGRTNSLSFHDW